MQKKVGWRDLNPTEIPQVEPHLLPIMARLVQASSTPHAPTWYQNFSDSLTVKAVRPIGNTGEFIVLTSTVNYPHEAMLKD